jgi:integrase
MASIRKRASKDGQVSYAVLFKHEGRQRSKTFATEKAANKFRKLVEAVGAADALEIGQQKKDRGPSVAELFEEWLEVKRPDMTTEGHRDYVRAYEKWIAKHLGWHDAELVTERHVQEWVNKVLRPKLGAKAVAKNHALLHGMFKWASSRTVGKISNDPCTETVLPKRKKRPPRGLSIPELHRMLSAGAKAGQTDAADVIAVMAGTGWRPGEVLGLRAGYVEVMGDGRVYVTMASVYRRGEGIVEDGKTEAAGRRIRVLGEGAAVLARRVVGLGITAPVFPHPTTGKPWSPASFGRHYWPKVVAAAGLQDRAPTPYWLRHTHVAICHAAGLTLPEIQRRIGHESIQTTIDVYGRMIDGMSDESADRLDALLRPQANVVAGEVLR